MHNEALTFGGMACGGSGTAPGDQGHADQNGPATWHANAQGSAGVLVPCLQKPGITCLIYAGPIILLFSLCPCHLPLLAMRGNKPPACLQCAQNARLGGLLIMVFLSYVSILHEGGLCFLTWVANAKVSQHYKFVWPLMCIVCPGGLGLMAHSISLLNAHPCISQWLDSMCSLVTL